MTTNKTTVRDMDRLPVQWFWMVIGESALAGKGRCAVVRDDGGNSWTDARKFK